MVVNNICLLHTSVTLIDVVTHSPAGEIIENKPITFSNTIIGYVVPYGGTITFTNGLSGYNMLLRPLGASNDVGTVLEKQERKLIMFCDYVIRAASASS